MLKYKLVVLVVTSIIFLISCVNTKEQVVNKTTVEQKIYSEFNKKVHEEVQKQLNNYLVQLLQTRNTAYSLEDWARHIKETFRPSNPTALVAWEGMWDDFIKEIRAQKDQTDALLVTAYLKLTKMPVPDKPKSAILPSPEDYLLKNQDY